MLVLKAENLETEYSFVIRTTLDIIATALPLRSAAQGTGLILSFYILLILHGAQPASKQPF
jgi:hypothetical protein